MFRLYSPYILINAFKCVQVQKRLLNSSKFAQLVYFSFEKGENVYKGSMEDVYCIIL